MAMICNPSGVGTAIDWKGAHESEGTDRDDPAKGIAHIARVEGCNWLETRPLCKLYMED